MVQRWLGGHRALEEGFNSKFHLLAFSKKMLQISGFGPLLPPHQHYALGKRPSSLAHLCSTLLVHLLLYAAASAARMILNLLSYLFIISLGAVALLCLAQGLLFLTQYIEAHAARSRRLGIRALSTITVVQLLIIVLDDVPFLPLIPSLSAAILHYRALSTPTWPFATSSSSGALSSLISLILLPLVSHVLLVRNHTMTAHAWHQHRYDTLQRPKLPGGRLDWDVQSAEPPGAKEMTNLQVCAVLAVCVWSIPVWRLLGRVAAAEWGSAGVVPEGRAGRGSGS